MNVSDEIVNDNNEVITSNDTNELFTSITSLCNEEHISYCSCQDGLKDVFFRQFMAEELEDLKKKGLENNLEVLNERLDFARTQANKETAYYCVKNNIRCSLEKEKIEQTLKLFSKKYDFNDPRIYIIIESLLHQMLSAFRMQKFSNNKGILNYWFDKEGNKRYEISPVEDAKLKYDDAKIKTILALDKIMEGEKINVLSIKTIEEVFKDFPTLSNFSEKEFKSIS